MKKLTAGILASLIGLVSANSADAAVASKAYVDGAIESLDFGEQGSAAEGSVTYIKNIKEVDGKIDATAGELAKVALSGDYGDLDTKLQIQSDGSTGSVVTGIELSENGNAVVVSRGNTDNTTYEFKDGDALDFTTAATVDENGNIVVEADVKYGDGLKIDAATGNLVTNADGRGTVDVTYENGQMIITGTDHYLKGDGIKLSTDETTGKTTISTDATGTGSVTVDYNEQGQMVINGTDTTLDNYNATGEDGLQVLTRKPNPNGEGYVYAWEEIDRAYDATDLDVDHDTEAGNTPATGA